MRRCKSTPFLVLFPTRRFYINGSSGLWLVSEFCRFMPRKPCSDYTTMVYSILGLFSFA